MKLKQYLTLWSSVVRDAEGAGAGGGEGGDAGAGAGGGTQYISAGSGGAEGGQDGTNGSGAGQSGSPFDALPEEDRAWLQSNGILKEDSDPAQAFTGLLKKARETERLVGQKVVVPGPDASEEEVKAFRRAAGVPNEPTGYAFSLPQDLPEDLPYNSQLAEGFKGIAHKTGLTPRQASELHNWFARQGANEMQSGKEAVRQRGVAATKALEQDWGPANSENYKANLEFAEQGARMLGGDELLNDFRQAGLLGPNGEVFSAKLAKALSNAGRALAAEDDGRLRGERAVVGNPFGEGGNVTEQMKLIKAAKEGKQDPKRIRSMMVAAGKKPSDIGLPDSWGT